MSIRTIARFDSVDCEWSSIEAVNEHGQKIANVKQVAYQVIDQGNLSYHGAIAFNDREHNDLLREVERSNVRDLLDLEFDIKIAFKERTVARLQNKTLRGLQILNRIENRPDFAYRCLFLKVELQ